MLNFAVGPVMMDDRILEIGKEQIPYFRTFEFSKVLLENEKYIKKFFKAKDEARVIFLTGSGTSAMEASLLNTLDENDKVLVINGGSFGQRFCEMCKVFGFNYTEIKCAYGKGITKKDLEPYQGKDYTALLVNLDETSTGVLYDIKLISEFCKDNDIFLIVDSISSFLCDPFNMQELGVNLVLTGSQKALAIPPGIAIVCVDEIAQARIAKIKTKSFYFNFKSYLENGKRGQTPFTPAVGILLQLHRRLKMIDENGGVDYEIKKVEQRALYFRNRIVSLPFNFFTEEMSNAVTALTLKDYTKSAYDLFIILKEEYGIYICPNGGELKDKVFRVGHMGNLEEKDYDTLIAAFYDLQRRNII